ncbi:hypothetical protein Trydic_g14573 [Trypoxylus dichotomus]
MFSLNRMGDGFASHHHHHHHHQKTRQLSTMAGKGSILNEMPSCTSFLDTINYQSISREKKFANPNFVNRNNPNVHSYPSNYNLQTSTPPLLKICKEFYEDNSNSTSSLPTKSFSTEHIMKENTQRSKHHDSYNLKKTKEPHRSPRKSHKNKMNIDIKYEIDEVGTDCLSDQFESDSNDATPIIEIETPPIFIHEAMPELDIKSEVCKIPSSPICIAIGSPQQVSAVVVSITENLQRCRMPSECSEDFVVFQYDEGDISYTESEIESDEEDSESVFSEEDDVCDFEKIDLEKSDDKCSKVPKKVSCDV